MRLQESYPAGDLRNLPGLRLEHLPAITQPTSNNPSQHPPLFLHL